MIKKYKIYWLIILVSITLFTIWIGGATRLTRSGLSMVDWNIITGTIPPLNEKDWQQEFDKYKKFPEYQKINFGMSLGEFKRIFYYEYFHRMAARMVGLVLLFPFLIFLLMRQISKREFFFYSGLFFLVFFQGIIGWIMVKSGLVESPNVSHIKLLIHFSLANLFLFFVLYGISRYCFQKKDFVKNNQKKAFSFFSLFILICLLIQMIYGVFMSGLRAKYISDTYPKMFNQWFPNIWNNGQSLFENLFYNHAFVHFFHRHFAIFVAMLILIFCFHNFFKKTILFKSGLLLFFLLVQIGLGILTILQKEINVALASSHQIVGVLFFQFFLNILIEKNRNLKKTLNCKED